MANYVITGSSTATGHPIYLDPAHRWTESLERAQVFDQETKRDAALQKARADEASCCDPYAIEVAIVSGRASALTLRERIRAEGPTTPIPRAGRRPSAA